MARGSVSYVLNFLRRFGRNDSGVAAIEFAIVAAVLIPSFLVAMDIGFVIRERIGLDHVLRMGAYTAIRPEPSPAVVEEVMRFALQDQQNARITSATVLVEQSCFCRAAPNDVLSCSVSCSPDYRIEVYDMRVTAGYDSIFLPHSLTERLSVLSASLRVEIPSAED